VSADLATATGHPTIAYPSPLPAPETNLLDTKNLDPDDAKPQDPGLRILSLASASTKTTLIKLHGLLNGAPCEFLVDSGSTGNFVADAFSRQHNLQLKPRPAKQLITLANGASSWCTDHVPQGLIQIGSFTEELDLDVTTLNHCDAILGKPWLTKNNPDIDWTTNKVFISTPDNLRVDLSAPETSLNPENLDARHAAGAPLSQPRPTAQMLAGREMEGVRGPRVCSRLSPL